MGRPEIFKLDCTWVISACVKQQYVRWSKAGQEWVARGSSRASRFRSRASAQAELDLIELREQLEKEQNKRREE